MILYIIASITNLVRNNEKKYLFIMYLSTLKDRDRRDSYGWSVLYGAYSAWKVAFQNIPMDNA